ncbi:MAG: hypothetical protein DRP16_00635 [Candidatus Aenigmatarchaeota archaeon]|nr:MAG: hypothetical protein DRP16_00635 [Candidatus Aenigmarchaeota archaeon]
MKFFVCSRLKKDFISKEIKSHGFKIDRQKPDFVFVYGGDGTILEAERKYPGVLKIPIRTHPSKHAEKFYTPKQLKKIFKSIKTGKYKIKKFEKVECSFKGRKLTGLNEIQVHNAKPYRPLRFSLNVDGKIIPDLIGDGVIISTPYGSTAYYSVIGGKPFSKGLMLGFNNVIERKKPVRIKKYAKLRVIRETGWIISDNNPKMLKIKPNEQVLIKKSKDTARFVMI